MLAFLETGSALYLLSAVCLIGIFSRLITGSLYKRLTKETGGLTSVNPTASLAIKSKRLKNLKQNAESTYRLNEGIRNTRAYLEHQLQSMRLLKVSLASWDRFSTRMTLLCFLLGGVGAFMAYWYRCDTYYIVLYGSLGILSGLLTMLPDAGTGPYERKQQLLTALQDYLENFLFSTAGSNVKGDSYLRETARNGIRESFRQEEQRERESEVIPEEPRRPERGHASIRKKDRMGKKSLMAVPSLPSVDREAVRAAAEKPSGERDAQSVKRSLEQIAASREKHRTADNNWIKELTPEEIRLIGDIIKEYLA